LRTAIKSWLPIAAALLITSACSASGLNSGVSGGSPIVPNAAPGSLMSSAAAKTSETKISAISQTTRTFDGGVCTADFTKAASGIINERNRRANCNYKEDIIQFRPIAPNPGTADPVCPATSETGPLVQGFVWSTTEATLTAGGLFVSGGSYNACFYPAVLATPAPTPAPLHVVLGPTVYSFDSGNCSATFTEYSNGVINETARSCDPTNTVSAEFRPEGTAVNTACPAGTSDAGFDWSPSGDPNLAPMFTNALYRVCWYTTGTTVSFN